MEWVAFVLVAATAIGAAVGLVIRPNPLHGALFLVANLFCVAVLYLMLRAEFPPSPRSSSTRARSSSAAPGTWRGSCSGSLSAIRVSS
jgi:uncharacterized membrane protein YfcA